MKKFILTLLILVPFAIKAQVTLIPDQNFENYLVHWGYDSDGLINGQILTSDALTVTELDFINKSPNNISWIDLDGFNDFANLEILKVQYGATNISFANLSNLKNIYLDNCDLTSFDATPLSSLEELILECSSLDVPPREIRELDFSNSPNFNYLNVRELSYLERISLRNNQASSVSIILYGGADPNLCIEVDNPLDATNNLPPYNNWSITWDGVHDYTNFYFSDLCTLSLEKFVNENFKIYPNPATDYVAVEQKTTDGVHLQAVQILDSSGKLVRSVKGNFDSINVSNLNKGVYLFVIQTDKGNKAEKIIVQ
ncbi:T9SS type A sorting domain-containing protein [Flavobacterium sp. CBA20B-1]|uniref:T9SS type A sorting domain-containing protein n=1 Tax=unclassified Flavobacterium TaxID=196869 RepID=UPI00222401A9|nr:MULTISPECIES: T9SS type A sorting domain-containing protein [unclassified Flavobacterium]WCM43409.1 T9SS type A sorting domain-containing protein [Flavobacterium sp. CBA20B-1]